MKNDPLKRTSVTVERVTLLSDRAFDDVLDGAVPIAYDTMESLLAPYEDERALAVARELDSQVLGVLVEAAR